MPVMRTACVARVVAVFVAIFVAMMGLASPGLAVAEPHSGVDSNLYRPAVDASGLFTVDGAETLERYDLAVQLGLDGGLRPLRVAVPGIGDGDSDDVLSFVLGLHMTVGFALTGRFTLVLDAGVYRTDTAAGYGERGRYNPSTPEPSTGLISLRPLSNIDPSGGFEATGLSGPLDARAGFKLHLIDGRALDLALVTLASIPFGDEEMFLGDSDFVFTPRLAAELGRGPGRQTRVLFNLGANLRRRTVLMAFDPGQMMTADDAQAVLDIGSELVVGAGVSHRLASRIAVAAEAVALLPLPEALSYGTCRLPDTRPCSALDDSMYFGDAGYGDVVAQGDAGLYVRVSGETTLRVGVGGTLVGARGDRGRASVGVLWTPLPAGVVGRGGGGDSDSDGIPDITDSCPNESEDPDDYQDEDGCPDEDNDSDGLVDSKDRCPDEPEDKDGVTDDDGCPDRDNDGDKIPDVVDRCIDQAEDVDGFDDDDGCPDPDNDQDGIPDDKDQCPNQAETQNGIADEDGCPDARTATGPVEEADRIDLRGNKIAFAGGRGVKLTSASEDLLEQIATIIKAGNLRIRIEVHVPLSTRSRNARAIARAQAVDKRLAQRRADAILNYLVSSKGVPLPAVQAVGIGSVRPIEQPATSEVNERVDFVKREQTQP